MTITPRWRVTGDIDIISKGMNDDLRLLPLEYGTDYVRYGILVKRKQRHRAGVWVSGDRFAHKSVVVSP